MKFSTAIQLYCYGTCGDDWLDNITECQKPDADAYCKLKYCNENSYALTFELSKSLDGPGFACDTYGENFGNFFGMTDIHFEEDVGSTHGHKLDNQVVSNIECDNGGKMKFEYLSYQNHN
jgi:hypothetical protein